MLNLLSGQGWKQAETTQEQQPLVPQGIQQPAVQQAQMVDRPKVPEQGDGQIPKNLLLEVPVTVIREDAMPKLQDTVPKPQDTMPKLQDTMPKLQGQQIAAVQQNAPSAEALGTVPRMPEQAVEMTEVLPAGKQPESAEAVPAGQSSAAVREVSVNPEAVQERAVHGAAAAQSVQANAKPEAAANVMTQQAGPEKIEFEPLRQLHQQPDMEQPSQQDAESGREQGFRSANEGQPVRQAAENLPSSAQQNAVNFQQSMQSARAAAAVDVQAPVSQLTQDFDIPEQIVEQARLIRRTENTEMVIQLKPEHLGELTLKVTVAANGSVNASFHSDNAQVRAIIEAACDVKLRGFDPHPEIMIPLVGEVKELKYVKDVVVETADAEIEAAGTNLEYEVGTMIEIPRAALTADEIAKEADFFCFGTNDLTQMTFGFSRDDAGKFLTAYYDAKIFENDPFAKLDQNGVGKLMDMCIKLGKPVNPSMHVGICGEHGGDPSSVEFCHKIGLDYVSCSPFRVPVARLAAAQAAVKYPRK